MAAISCSTGVRADPVLVGVDLRVVLEPGERQMEQVMIDFSHANSEKQHRRQIDVGEDVAAQIAGGDSCICGVMIESHLEAGRQDLLPGQPLKRGVSITDACLGWSDTQPVLRLLAHSVRERRTRRAELARR